MEEVSAAMVNREKKAMANPNRCFYQPFCTGTFAIIAMYFEP
jgi:hypothetical protein